MHGAVITTYYYYGAGVVQPGAMTNQYYSWIECRHIDTLLQRRWLLLDIRMAQLIDDKVRTCGGFVELRYRLGGVMLAADVFLWSPVLR